MRATNARKPKGTKPSNRRPALRGKGDYALEVTSIKNPITRLEGKIDHLERSLVRNPLSKANAASTIGRTLGSLAGQGDLGALAGSTLAKFFGHGDYSVHSNSLMGRGPSAQGAKFSTEGRGTRIVEREYIGDIRSGALSGASTVFNVSTFDIQPTNSSTFPWLSRMAHLYDQWEPNGIVFEFVSTSSEYNGTSQALGAVIMATDYDPFDPPFDSKQRMENADYACSTKPALGLLHGIECAVKERPTPLLYTSTSNGAPVTSTSLGRFNVATQGCSVAGVTLGELWVSYDLTFYKKQLATATVSVPFIRIAGSVGAGNPYILGTVLASDTITVTQNVGVGSVVNFNNLGVARYQYLYQIFTAGSRDDTDLRNYTITNGTLLLQRVAFDTAGGPNMLISLTIQATAPNCTVTTTTVDSGANKVFAFSAVQVPDSYNF